MKKDKIISDALLVATSPIIGYLLLTTYYDGAESNLRLPPGIGTVDIYQSITIGFIISLVLAIGFLISDVISRIIPTKTITLLRFRRIAQVSMLLGFCFAVTATQSSTIVNIDGKFLKSFIVLSLAASIPFIFRDILLPNLKYRKIKNIDKRLNKSRANKVFATTKEYYKTFLNTKNIGFLLIPLLIINTITFNAGKASTNPSEGREYIIIQSTPKQIVLINYGDRWVTAMYDDSYPGKPAYRQEYSIVDKADMARSKFIVKYISQLYVYN